MASAPGKALAPPNLTSEVVRRFWSKVDRTGGPDSCWLWLATKKPQGYGMFCVETRRYIAHRFAFHVLRPWLDITDLELHHVCENPACVNPKHITPMTRHEHSIITFRSRTHCKNGHEYTPENCYFCPRGRRSCRTCARLWARRRRAGVAATPQPEPSGAGQPPTSEAPPGLPSPLGGARVEESTPNEYPDAPDPASMVRDLQDALRGTTGGIARPHSPAQEWAALLAEVRSLAATPQPEEHP